MSRYEFKLPDIGEGVTEGEIVEWHVKAGDLVKEDQPLVEVMTDKATVTITSPKTGRIVELFGSKGTVVKVHSVLVVYDLSQGSPVAETKAEPKAPSASGPAATAVGDIKESLPGMDGIVDTLASGARPNREKDKVASTEELSLEKLRQGLAGPPPGFSPGSGPPGVPDPPAPPGAIPPTVTGNAFSVSNNPFSAAATTPPATEEDEGPVEEYEAPGGKALATPATRKLARDLGVDLAKVPPTGPGGRVTKDDVRAYAERAEKPVSGAFSGVSNASGLFAPPTIALGGSTPEGAAGAFAQALAPESKKQETAEAPSESLVDELSKRDTPERAAFKKEELPEKSGTAEQPEDRFPLRGVRRKIAEKMHQSKNTAAHFTFVEEVDCTELKELRDRLKPKAEKLGAKLSFLPFIVKAVVAALKKHPTLNSSLDEKTNELVYKRYYNIGIATATDNGLIVPVVKQADRRSIMDVAREIDRLATAARAGKVPLEDLQGGTFTITSLGAQGGLFATPIINYPESAILGVHQMKQKPVVRNGQIVIGDVMLLSLSFDHRIIDGHVGAAFAYEIINFLQDPDLLLLDY